MNALLEELKREWKKMPGYKDVEAEYWVPGQGQIEKCPNGCKLEIHGNTPEGWIEVSGRDFWRLTKICRKHGFARIYIITALTASAVNWSPQNS